MTKNIVRNRFHPRNHNITSSYVLGFYVVFDWCFLLRVTLNLSPNSVAKSTLPPRHGDGYVNGDGSDVEIGERVAEAAAAVQGMRVRGRFRHGGGGRFHFPGSKIHFPGDEIHFPGGEINPGMDVELDGDTMEHLCDRLEHGRDSLEHDSDTLQHGSDTLEHVRDGLQRGTEKSRVMRSLPA